MSKPLDGVHVIEIAQEIAGPAAGLFLADLGADVVKLENKNTGDTSRWLFPKLVGGPDVSNPTLPPMFIGANRGKRSMAADLKNPRTIEIVHRMVKAYDVLLTNYLPASSIGSASAGTSYARSIRNSFTRKAAHGDQ
jgi:crotonobetainyl-CoA:carnitine CoA-transferase CaiB-like acyl-CoA transferase